MSDLLYDIQNHLALLTINREHKRNAFDSALLTEMIACLHQANNNPTVRVIILKAHGAHFSAGADIAWMKSMAEYSEEENRQDALILGQLMYNLHHSPKPVIAMIQGAAFGGGAGLAAACTFAIGADSARFCFSEVKLGLIPAVISPYVVKAIGARAALMLFTSAEVFDAAKAQALGLIQHCVSEEQLLAFTHHYAEQIAHNAPDAVRQSVQLVRDVIEQPINEHLMHYTASLIAKKRVSSEGQQGLHAFLNKTTPQWN